MAIGQRATIALRESPSAGSRVTRSLPGSEVLWAQALSPDGRWLQVTYDETGATAWVARGDVSLFGDPAEPARACARRSTSRRDPGFARCFHILCCGRRVF